MISPLFIYLPKEHGTLTMQISSYIPVILELRGKIRKLNEATSTSHNDFSMQANLQIPLLK